MKRYDTSPTDLPRAPNTSGGDPKEDQARDKLGQALSLQVQLLDVTGSSVWKSGLSSRLSYCGAFRTQLVPKLAPRLQPERNLARFARQIALGLQSGR